MRVGVHYLLGRRRAGRYYHVFFSFRPIGKRPILRPFFAVFGRVLGHGGSLYRRLYAFRLVVNEGISTNDFAGESRLFVRVSNDALYDDSTTSCVVSL